MTAFEVLATGVEFHDISTTLNADDIDDAQEKAEDAIREAHPEFAEIEIDSVREITNAN